MAYNIPILFVFFNRLEIAVESFEQIRKVKPSRLYLASDGPRHQKAGENVKVETVRKVILDLIDWECEVKTLFQKRNLGCGLGVKTAIDWLFDAEEEGIVLEDDCIPQDSFFTYMTKLLKRYRKDNRIGMISGMNHFKEKRSDDSYFFSTYKSCWGWATWRRAWKNMDLNMNWRDSAAEFDILKNMGFEGKDLEYWKYRLKLIDAKDVSAWDWQWYFSLSAQNQLSIFPKVSLISNIGFTEEATHTSSSAKDAYFATGEMKFPMQHPKYIVPSNSFDKAYYKDNENFYRKIIRHFPISVKSYIRNLVRG